VFQITQTRRERRGGSDAVRRPQACLQVVPSQPAGAESDAAKLDGSQTCVMGPVQKRLILQQRATGYELCINSPSRRLQVFRSMIMFPALLHSFSQACYAWSTGALASQPRPEIFLRAWHGAAASLITSLITCLHLTAGQVLRLVSITETHPLFPFRSRLEASRAPLTRRFPFTCPLTSAPSVRVHPSSLALSATPQQQLRPCTKIRDS
jgi:hypothetical protein